MAQKDADLATDYAKRTLFLSEETVAEFAIAEVAVNQETDLPIVFLIEDGAAGTPTDSTPPVISNMTPTPGEITPETVIEFDVEDVLPGIVLVTIGLKYTSSPETIVVHDGAEFKVPFDTSSSSRIAIPNGYHFTLAPAGGWTGNFTLEVKAVDGDGNLLG